MIKKHIINIIPNIPQEIAVILSINTSSMELMLSISFISCATMLMPFWITAVGSDNNFPASSKLLPTEIAPIAGKLFNARVLIVSLQ